MSSANNEDNSPLWFQKLKDRVAQVYYTHGLFCASHPFFVICFTILIVLLCCYPLTKLPLPGSAPLEFITPIKEYSVPLHTQITGSPNIEESPSSPKWYQGEPVGYIQQLVVKAAVSPWKSDILIPTDVFRAPLGKVFEILETVNNFQGLSNGSESKTMANFCLHVDTPLRHHHVAGLLPEFNCLIISPANLWRQDYARYQGDAHLIETIFSHQGKTIETSPNIKDIAFGIPWKESGIKKYFVRNRQQVLTYAITVVLQSYSREFINQLKEKLHTNYPLTKNHSTSQNDIPEPGNIVHIYFKEQRSLVEYIPLMVTYVILFLYIYFSVSKIELVKSKWGLAFSAVVTVIASLMMSVGMCSLFGLAPTLNGSEIFPYLVVIIGLENILVVTKSVVSTPVHLDVKLRIAQGLSKEGWSITKNIVAEFSILMLGFLTSIPALQEFCMFAAVGLLSDFFLQIVFFTTVLSIDIRRMELSDLHKQSVQQDITRNQATYVNYNPLIRCPVLSWSSSFQSRLSRSASSPKLQTLSSSTSPTNSQYSSSTEDPNEVPSLLPKRLRVLYFWARTRMVQRFLMVCTLIWIFLILYKSGIVAHFTFENSERINPHFSVPYEKLVNQKSEEKNKMSFSHGESQDVTYNTLFSFEYYKRMQEGTLHREESMSSSNSLHLLNHELWRQLSYRHWPTVFGYYNIPLAGRYISILPVIPLSITVDPDEAIRVRHQSEEEAFSQLKRSPFSAHFDYEEFDHSQATLFYNGENIALYPLSTAEKIITIILAIPSMIFFIYIIVQLYKCMCSRNYPKWRRSWTKRCKKGYIINIMESVPVVLDGHLQDVECFITDGTLIASSCLGGELRIWDSISGECLSVIQRKSICLPFKRSPCYGADEDDDDPYLEGLSPATISPSSSPGDVTLGFSSTFKCRTDSFSGIKRPDLSSYSSSPKRFSAPAALLDKMPLSKEENLTNENLDPQEKESQAFDFSKFSIYYEQHLKALAEAQKYVKSDPLRGSGGDILSSIGAESLNSERSISSECLSESSSIIWCLAFQDGIVVAGCGNGSIEIWDAFSGVLKCAYDEVKEGVVGLCFTGNRIVAARLNGMVDFLELESCKNIGTGRTSASHTMHNRNHGHLSSSRTRSSDNFQVWDGGIQCTLVHSGRAHQQPITSLQNIGGRVLTASLDHTLKVFRLEDSLCLYTLHGHSGPITTLFLDQEAPLAALSGSEDCTVRVWDLMTASCVHILEGHTCRITALTATSIAVVSLALDDRLCIWNRFTGYLLHNIQMDKGCCSSLAMLTNNLLVTGKQGSLVLWDIKTGEAVRIVRLGDCDHSAFVHQIRIISSSVVICDYGTQLKVIRFPLVLEKAE